MRGDGARRGRLREDRAVLSDRAAQIAQHDLAVDGGFDLFFGIGVRLHRRRQDWEISENAIDHTDEVTRPMWERRHYSVRFA